MYMYIIVTYIIICAHIQYTVYNYYTCNTTTIVGKCVIRTLTLPPPPPHTHTHTHTLTHTHLSLQLIGKGIEVQVSQLFGSEQNLLHHCTGVRLISRLWKGGRERGRKGGKEGGNEGRQGANQTGHTQML